MQKLKDKDELIPLTFDKMFKKVFGSDNSKDFIKYLLKCVLKLEVKDVTIINNEIIGEVYKDKNMEVDVIVKLLDDTKIIVEMNSNADQSIINRNLFYMARIMGHDLDRGDNYYQFHDHIQINFDAKGSHKRPIMRYRLREDEDVTNELSDKLTIYKIDVPYFTKKCYTNNILKLNETDKFIGLLGCDSKSQAYKIVGDDRNMKKILRIVEKFSSDSDYSLAYDAENHRRQLLEIDAQSKVFEKHKDKIEFIEAVELVEDDMKKRVKLHIDLSDAWAKNVELSHELAQLTIDISESNLQPNKQKIINLSDQINKCKKEKEKTTKEIKYIEKEIDDINHKVVTKLLNKSVSMDNIIKITKLSKNEIDKISQNI